MHIQKAVRVSKQTFPLKSSRFEDQKVHVIAALFINDFHQLAFIYFLAKIRSRLVKKNCVVNEKYPAQMLEVAGDLRRAPAKFENPEMTLICQQSL